MPLPDPAKFGAVSMPDPAKFGAKTTGGASTFVGQRPPTPDEQTSKDILAKTSFDVETSASPGTIAKTSFADDPEIMVREYAKTRFPDMPVDEAMSRYAVIEDNIIYKGKDGKYYSEIPQGMSPGALARKGASYAGPAIPFATGTAGAIASAPMLLTGPWGAAGSVGLTGVASAGGEAIKQGLGKYLTGDPVSGKDIAIEGVAGGLGQLLGAGAVKFMGRGVARDVGRLNMDDAMRLQNKANQLGVKLTPAELTNLPSLKAQQKALGNLTQTSDDILDFYVKRADQVGDAVTSQLGKISPIDSAEVAGQMTRQAASDAMESVAKQRAAQASPLYKQAFASGAQVDVSPVTKYIDGQLKFAKGEVAATLQKAKSYLMQNAPGETGEQAIDTSVEGLHQAKLAIDDLIQKRGESSIGNVAKGQLKQVQKQLVKAIDDASPDYKAARQIFADLSPEVSQVREGVAGIIADLPDTKLQTAAASIFNPSKVGPGSVRMVREQISKANPEAWQAIKRAWLQENWEKAGKEFATSGGKLSQGAKFRALLLGDTNKRRIMKEALNPDEYRALSDLADVLEASGRVKPVGSDTAWNQEMMKSMRTDATPGLAKAARLFSPQKWGQMVEDWATEKAFSGKAGSLLDAITSPQSLEKLKELRKVSPQSARAAAIAGSVLRIVPDAFSPSIEGERIGRMAYPEQAQQ